MTTSNLEDMVAPPAFQRNLVSGCTGPDTEIDRTSEFHDGQPERSLKISNTTSGGASIWICPSATAGAVWSISMVGTLRPWRSVDPGAQDAELVAFRIGEDDPRNIALTHIGVAGAERRSRSTSSD